MDESERRRIIHGSFAQSIAVKQAALEALAPRIEAAAQLLITAYREGRQALFMGNGGSAADAQHLAAELVGRYRQERRALPALALHANTSVLTAVGNDYGYQASFLRPLEAHARPGDVVIGLSTSGNSANVAAALAWARRLPTPTLALTGAGGGAMRSHADILLDVPSRDTPRIQECHILIGHILCELVERDLFAAESTGGAAKRP